MIETVKIQGDGYLVNGTMSVPNTEGNRHYQEVLAWLSEGNIPEPEFTDAELLTNAKRQKKEELDTAFQVASKLPVTVGTKTYNGGKDSAQALRDYIQLVQESGGTEYQIWDTTNVISLYTLTEANAIKLAVGAAVAQEEFILRNKKNLVDSALTVAEVEAI